MDEPESAVVRDAMAASDHWFICRVGYVETSRAVGLAAGPTASGVFAREWPAFGVVEVDQQLAEHAAALAVEHELRSLDALHLASALLLDGPELVVATWDLRLRESAGTLNLQLLPSEPRHSSD